MIHRLIQITAVLLFAVGLNTGNSMVAAEPRFTSLFNDVELTGWDGDKEAWTVRDGAIQSVGGKSKKSWLIWRGGELQDFELRLRYKFTKGQLRGAGALQGDSQMAGARFSGGDC